MRHASSLIIIRHAQTDMAGSFCGHSDPPINAQGCKQVRELLSALESERIDVVYTSDLQRAVLTGTIIAEQFNIPLEQREGLREINFGDWEGLTWQEAEVRDPVYAQQWIDSFPCLSPPNGEPFDAFERRVCAEISELSLAGGNKRTAIVTHAGVMRTILTNLCSVDSSTSWALTASYCSFFNFPFKSPPAASGIPQ